MLPFLLLSGCSREDTSRASPDSARPGRQAAGDTPKSTAETSQKPAINFPTPWQTESEYVVTRIVSELANFYSYSRYQKALLLSASSPPVKLTLLNRAADGTPIFHIQIAFSADKTIECDANLTSGIFAVETYRPLSARLEEASGGELKRTTSAVSTQAETILLENKSDVLLQMDHNLSGELQVDFNNPILHEQAALLIEAFALRDCSGRFFNLLPELSRITAHRVFADALRRGASGGHRETLTRALEDVLIGEESRALEAAQALPSETPFSAWKRILRIRVTGDFRIFGESENPTLLERVEWFRALSTSVDAEIAQQRYTIPESLRSMPDWWRILNTAHPSVQTGHLLSEVALRSELAETVSVFTKYGNDRPADKAVLIRALNAPECTGVQNTATNAGNIQILGWSLWAQLLQRQICYAITADFDFMENRWGVPDEARSYRSRVDQTFGALVLYPFVKRLNATSENYYHQAQDGAMKLVRTTPELIPAGAWNEMSYPVEFCALYIPPPHPYINEWHRDNPLPGTVYDINPRLSHPSLTARADIVSLIEQLHQKAPYSEHLINYQLYQKSGQKPSPAQSIEAYRTLLDYRPYLCRYIADLFAQHHDTAHQEEWLLRSVTIDPSGYRMLGHLYRDQKRDAEAANVFAQWIDNEHDDVAVSNDSAWLIEYYEHHGQSDEATHLADRAGEVYSHSGLIAKAHLLEERKNTESALEYYNKASERYEAPGLVLGFLMRHQKDDVGPLEPELLKHLLETYFPSGMTKINSANVSPPEAGVLVSVHNSSIDEAGLKVGDIIAGVRGYNVSDWSHFKIIRDFEPSESYELLVWRGGKGITLPPLPANFRFGVDLPSYRK